MDGSCRDLTIINRCAKFQPQQCIPHIVQLLVLSHRDYRPVVWSSASNKDLERFKSVQNRVAWLTLNCNIIRLHITSIGHYWGTGRLFLCSVIWEVFNCIKNVLYHPNLYYSSHARGCFSHPVSKMNARQNLCCVQRNEKEWFSIRYDIFN